MALVRNNQIKKKKQRRERKILAKAKLANVSAGILDRTCMVDHKLHYLPDA
jgi:hypothetical protein